MVKWFGSILIASLFGLAVSVADAARRDAAEDFYQQAKAKYYQLITSNHSGDETEWKICVEMFRKVSLNYPQSRRAPEALFTEGLLYANMHHRFGRNETLYQAINAYQKLIDDSPHNSLSDDAMYNIAIIYYEDMAQKEKAAAVLHNLRRMYPKSELSSQAKQLLDKLRLGNNEKATVIPLPSNQNQEQPESKLPSNIAPTPSSQIKVDEIRTWSNPDYTRVSIYLSGKGNFEHRLLKKDPAIQMPYRLYVDIPSAKLTSNANREILIKDSLLERVRAGQYTLDTTRVVLDMTSVYDYQISSRSDPDRIIIDVQGAEPVNLPIKTAPEVAREIAPEVEKAQTPKIQPKAKTEVVEPTEDAVQAEREVVAILEGLEKSAKEELKKDTVKVKPVPRKENLVDIKSFPYQRTIVIDPGHGGDDPGAKGPTGAMEKEVVLSIALKLRDFLTTFKGIRVVMTRDSDVFVPLEKRSLIANENRGDLFISIHANASPKQKASGISTYVFDNAKDEYSKRLEEVENASIIRGEKNEPDFLKLMFRSMTKNYFTNQSIELASTIQDAMIHGLRPRYKTVNNLGVRQAMFYVLWNTEMPAILVESSFITNRTEENRLRSEAYQHEVARSIATGIEGYLEQRYAMQLSHLQK